MSWSATIDTVIGSLRVHAELSGGHAPVGLVGPNGSGKTTLARTLVGAQRLQSGRIVVAGEVLADARSGVHLPPHRRGIGYLPQGSGLFPHLDVLDNVGFGLSGPRADRRGRAYDALHARGLEGLASRTVDGLSGGERQQVALVRALVAEPTLLVLDEPLAAMDARARQRVRRDLAESLAGAAVPALVITHDLRDLEALDAQVHVLEAGRVVQSGSTADLVRAPATAFVAELVQRPGGPR